MTKINEPLEKDLTLLQNQLKDTSPLIHCITNPISINDCANMVLAIGGRPIMAEHPGEVAEITAISQALALNLGNITDARMESMVIAGKTAKEKAVPITIDLVGTACSTMRKDYAQKLLAEIQPQIIKGNISEIRAVCGLESHSSGIDATMKRTAMRVFVFAPQKPSTTNRRLLDSSFLAMSFTAAQASLVALWLSL